MLRDNFVDNKYNLDDRVMFYSSLDHKEEYNSIYTSHNGMMGTICRILTEEEADLEEVGSMYEVDFGDCIIDVFEDELVKV